MGRLKVAVLSGLVGHSRLSKGLRGTTQASCGTGHSPLSPGARQSSGKAHEGRGSLE